MLIDAYRFGGGAGGTYLDDLATVPVAAIGLTKLISTAVNAMRVRRSSDNTEQDIGFSGDALDTASLASFVGANNGFVVTWYDQTGNGFHATQATTSKQPRIVNAGVYDGAVVFDGSSDGLKMTAVTMGSAFAGLYTRMAKAAWAATEVLFELSDNYNSYGGTAFVVYGDGGPRLNIGISNANQYNPFTIPATTLLSILFDKGQATAANEMKLHKDGTFVAPTGSIASPTTGTFTTRDFYIGARATTSLYSDQSMQSLVLYNADTAAIRASIEAIL